MVELLKITESQVTARDFLEGREDSEEECSDLSGDEEESSKSNAKSIEFLPSTAGTYLHFVMELCEKATLKDYIDNEPKDTKGALLIFQQICSGVDYIHSRGQIHRCLSHNYFCETLINSSLAYLLGI